MTKLQIRQEILKATKRIKEDYKVNISLWHAVDTRYEDNARIDVVYNTIHIIDKNDATIDHEITLKSDEIEQIEETESNLEMLRKEQKQLSEFLSEWFTVEIYEGNV